MRFERIYLSASGLVENNRIVILYLVG